MAIREGRDLDKPERRGKRPPAAKAAAAADKEPAAAAVPMRSERLRVRAAWMYYVEQMTQNEIAAALGIGRVTVVRLLAEARARQEVLISVGGELAEITALERALEQRFGLGRAIVAPLSSAGSDPVPSIGAAVGAFLSDAVQADMVVGLGWGRTLLQALPFVEARSLDNLRVISLLGGIAEARRFNPAEFVWRFAQIFGGNAYLLAAPAVVDSIETKRALIEKCGLGRIIDMASALDLVVVSAGGMTPGSTTFRVGYLSEDVRRSLLESGAVGDLLFHFFDRDGRLVDHRLNELVMSVGIERVKSAKQRILVSGGAEKAAALPGAMKLIRPNVFITDEASARTILSDHGENR